MNSRLIEVTLKELINELEYVPSYTNILVERVPIEFADFTYKINMPGVNTLTLMQAQQNQKNEESNNSTITMQTKEIIHSGLIQNTDNLTNLSNTNIVQNNQKLEMNNSANVVNSNEDKNMPMEIFTPDELNNAFENSKFFIIRSANQENVQISRQHEEWATTKANENKLNEAFDSSKYVFLIFAVSKTFHFQGYALMVSKSSNKTSFLWKSSETIRLGGSFKIKWISYYLLSFNRIANMTNPYCENELIKKSRDCTEIEPTVGKELCSLFEIPFRNINTPNPLQKIISNNLKNQSNDILSQNLTKAQLIEKLVAGNKSQNEKNKKDKKVVDLIPTNRDQSISETSNDNNSFKNKQSDKESKNITTLLSKIKEKYPKMSNSEIFVNFEKFIDKEISYKKIKRSDQSKRNSSPDYKHNREHSKNRYRERSKESISKKKESKKYRTPSSSPDRNRKSK